MMKIAVFQTAFPGDVILATPVFEALKDIWPECFLAAVIRPESYPLLKNNPYIDDIILYDKYGKDRGVRGILRFSGLLKNFDRAILIQRFLRSALIPCFARIRKRTGFASSPAKFLYTEKIPYDKKKHEVLRCLDLIGAREPQKYQPKIFIDDETIQKANRLLSKIGAAVDYAVVAPGSVWATKRYPHYPKLIDLIKREFHLDTILLGSADDRELADNIAGRARCRPFNIAGTTDLLVSSEIMARAKIVFTNDSAPAHIAAAVGIPVVAIFGPTVPEFGFSPYSEKSRVVDIGPLYCRPCTSHGSRKCPQKHFRCMIDLAPEKIIEAARPLLI